MTTTARAQITVLAAEHDWTVTEIEKPWARGRVGGADKLAHSGGARIVVDYTPAGRVASATLFADGHAVTTYVSQLESGKRARVVEMVCAEGR
jgi:prepilin-type processing-associated H-X9-DG protein